MCDVLVCMRASPAPAQFCAQPSQGSSGAWQRHAADANACASGPSRAQGRQLHAARRPSRWRRPAARARLKAAGACAGFTQRVRHGVCLFLMPRARVN